MGTEGVPPLLYPLPHIHSCSHACGSQTQAVCDSARMQATGACTCSHPQQGCFQENKLIMQSVRAACCQCRHARAKKQGSGKVCFSTPRRAHRQQRINMLPGLCLLQLTAKSPAYLKKQQCAHKDAIAAPSVPYHCVFQLPPDARRQCMKSLTASAVLLRIPHGSSVDVPLCGNQSSPGFAQHLNPA